MAKVLDLNALIPEERCFILGEKRVDVSKIPARVTLELAQKEDVIRSESMESFEVIFDLAVKVCQVSDKSITKDWIIDNCELGQLQELIRFVLQPLNERAEKNV